MNKMSKKTKFKLINLVILFSLIIGAIYPPLLMVYADNEDSNNILESTVPQEQRDNYLKSVSYNDRMFILMTYQILTSQLYNDDKSGYSDILNSRAGNVNLEPSNVGSPGLNLGALKYKQDDILDLDYGLDGDIATGDGDKFKEENEGTYRTYNECLPTVSDGKSSDKSSDELDLCTDLKKLGLDSKYLEPTFLFLQTPIEKSTGASSKIYPRDFFVGKEDKLVAFEKGNSKNVSKDNKFHIEKSSKSLYKELSGLKLPYAYTYYNKNEIVSSNTEYRNLTDKQNNNKTAEKYLKLSINSYFYSKILDDISKGDFKGLSEEETKDKLKNTLKYNNTPSDRYTVNGYNDKDKRVPNLDTYNKIWETLKDYYKNYSDSKDKPVSGVTYKKVSPKDVKTGWIFKSERELVVVTADKDGLAEELYNKGNKEYLYSALNFTVPNHLSTKTERSTKQLEKDYFSKVKLNDKDLTNLAKKVSEIANKSYTNSDGTPERETNSNYASLGWIPIYPFETNDNYLKKLTNYYQENKMIEEDDNADGNLPILMTDLLQAKKVDNSSPVIVTKSGEGKFRLGINSSIERGTLQNFPSFDNSLKEKSFDENNKYGEQLFYPMSKSARNKGLLGYNPTQPDESLGLDNYGNLVNGATGQVVVPYWHNTALFPKVANSSEAYISSPLVNYSKSDFDKYYASLIGKDKELVNSIKFNPKEPKVTRKELKDLGLNDEAVDKTIAELQNIFSNGSPMDVSQYYNEIVGSDGGVGEERNAQKLWYSALAIAGKNRNRVMKYNSEFLSEAQGSSQLYVGLSNVSGGKAENDNDLSEFNASGLLKQIWIIINVGPFELIRKGIAQGLMLFYSKNITSLDSLFYTETISSDKNYQELLGALVMIYMGLLGIFMLWWIFQVARGRLTMGGFLIRFISSALLWLVPAGYGNFVDIIINKPTTMLLGTQMKKMSIVDLYMRNTTEEAEGTSDIMAEFDKLFYELDTIDYKDQLLEKSKSYLLFFPTTTHNSGFNAKDVLDPMNAEERMKMSSAQQLKVDTMLSTDLSGIPWNKDELVNMGISSFDLNNWVIARDRGTTDKPLFEWLGTESNKTINPNYDAYTKANLTKEEDKQGAITNYTEYGVDFSKYFTDNQKSNLGSKDVIVDNKNLTASELYLKLYQNLKGKDDEFNNFSKLGELAQLVNSGKYTSKEIDLVVNELSRTSKVRKTLNEGNKNFSGYTSEVLATLNLDEPEEDFLGLSEIINEIVPYRQYATTTLDSDIYEINRKTIYNYLETYAPLRKQMDKEQDGSTEDLANANNSYNSAERMAFALESLFTVNSSLHLKLFPTKYEPNTVSFDSYMRALYVPIKEMNPQNLYTSNIATYIAVREEPIALGLFFLSIIALVVFSLIYTLVFKFLMLIMTIVTFTINFILKSDNAEDRNNAIWGNIITYGTFSLVKFGLLAIVWICTLILNSSYEKNGGITFPHVTIFSIIILGYIVFTIWKIIIPRVKDIIANPTTLGGEVGKKKLADVTVGKLAKTSLGQSLKLGGFGLKTAGFGASMALGSAMFAGRQLKNIKTGEGVSGKLSRTLYNQVNKQGAIDRTVDKLNGVTLSTIQSRINSSISQSKWGGKGITKFNSMKSAINNGKSSLVGGLNALAYTLPIEKHTRRIDTLKDGESITNVDNVSIFDIEDEYKAEKLVQLLNENGHDSVQIGSSIKVNTMEYDMDNPGDKQAFIRKVIGLSAKKSAVNGRSSVKISASQIPEGKKDNFEFISQTSDDGTEMISLDRTRRGSKSDNAISKQDRERNAHRISRNEDIWKFIDLNSVLKTTGIDKENLSVEDADNQARNAVEDLLTKGDFVRLPVARGMTAKQVFKYLKRTDSTIGSGNLDLTHSNTVKSNSKDDKTLEQFIFQELKKSDSQLFREGITVSGNKINFNKDSRRRAMEFQEKYKQYVGKSNKAYEEINTDLSVMATDPTKQLVYKHKKEVENSPEVNQNRHTHVKTSKKSNGLIKGTLEGINSLTDRDKEMIQSLPNQIRQSSLNIERLVGGKVTKDNIDSFKKIAINLSSNPSLTAEERTDVQTALRHLNSNGATNDPKIRRNIQSALMKGYKGATKTKVDQFNMVKDINSLLGDNKIISIPKNIPQNVSNLNNNFLQSGVSQSTINEVINSDSSKYDITFDSNNMIKLRHNTDLVETSSIQKMITEINEKTSGTSKENNS